MINEELSTMFTVVDEDAGERIDICLSRLMAGRISRSRVQKLIVDGKVSVNDTLVQKSAIVAEGDRIVVNDIEPINTTALPEPQDIPLSILFEDDYLIAVDKPAGLVVHPGSGNRSGTLVNALLYCRQLSEGSSPDRPGIVHRLDKDTSGIIIIAKTNAAHAALASAFSSRLVTKTYYGFCIGTMREPQGIIDLPIGKSRSNPIKQTTVEGGKSSQTEYQMLCHAPGVSFVRFRPRTGRTHQIRVHCSCKGFPILADDLYGGGAGRLMRLEPGDRPFARQMLACFNRHALHAQTLLFTHPFTGKEISLSAPFPADFGEAQQLMKCPIL